MSERSNYAQLLRDPRWQRKRLEIMARSGWACDLCGDTEMELHVHHREYRDATAPWEYGDEELQCLCGDCHTLAHLPIGKVEAFLGPRRQIVVKHVEESVDWYEMQYRGIFASIEKEGGAFNDRVLNLVVYAEKLRRWKMARPNFNWEKMEMIDEHVKAAILSNSPDSTAFEKLIRSIG